MNRIYLEGDNIIGEDALKLKVAEASQQDVGKGIVRISEEQLEKLGLGALDIVEIAGSRSTGAIAVHAYSQDHGLDLIRMDGLLRSNAGTSIGQYVEVKKADWSEALQVTLAPVAQGMQIYASGEGLSRIF